MGRGKHQKTPCTTIHAFPYRMQMALRHLAFPFPQLTRTLLLSSRSKVRKGRELSPLAWKPQPISLLSRGREDLPAPVGSRND